MIRAFASGSGVRWVLAGGLLLCGCKSEKERLAQAQADLTEVRAYVDKLLRIRSSLPPSLSWEVPCQSPEPESPSVVDVFFLDALSGEGKPENVAYTQSLRSSAIDRPLFAAWSRARTLAADKLVRSTDDGVAEVTRQVQKTRQLAARARLGVLLANQFEPPACDAAGCTAGSLTGWLVVFDQQQGKPLCYSPLEVRSSAQVQTAEGVPVSIRASAGEAKPAESAAVPSAAGRAMARDFRQQVEAAQAAALQKMKAVGTGTLAAPAK